MKDCSFQSPARGPCTNSPRKSKLLRRFPKLTITKPSSHHPPTTILKTSTNQRKLHKTLLHFFACQNGISLQCARPSRRLGHPPRPQPRPRRPKKRSPPCPFLSSPTQTSCFGKR